MRQRCLTWKVEFVVVKVHFRVLTKQMKAATWKWARKKIGKNCNNNHVKRLSKDAIIVVMTDNKCFVNGDTKRNIYDQRILNSAIGLTKAIRRATKLTTKVKKTPMPSCLLLSTTRCMTLYRQDSKNCLVTTVD